MESPKYEPSSATAPQIERRRYERYPAQVQIEIHEIGRAMPLRMETTDLSRGGCYVQLVTTLAIGAHIDTTLWIGGAPIRIRGLVVTRHPQFGNGIMFLDFKGDGKELLDRYLDAMVEQRS